MKFFEGDPEHRIAALIKFILRIFLKFPGWAKFLTILIIFSFILQAIQGIQNKFIELTQSSNSAVNSPASSVPPPATDPFSDGVSKATNAANLAQTARSLNEWNKVAGEWEAAINFMKAVSPTHPNYQVAQQRIVTYPKNLAYAKKNVEKLQQKQSNSTSSSNTSASSSSTSSRTFLGRSETGYELWADRRCIYVKGITEADLARLNTDVWGFKKAVKLQTGYKCVLFE